MILDSITSLLQNVTGIGKTVADRLIPDKNLAAQVGLEIEKEITAQNFSLAEAQIEVNKTEAGSLNFFVAGWRPAVGWVCVLGLAYQFLVWPLFCWLNAWLKLSPTQPPTLDLGTLMTLLTGMLGLGVMRTTEKLKDAQGNH